VPACSVVAFRYALAIHPLGLHGQPAPPLYSGTEKRLACGSLVIVGMREPRHDLYRALIARDADLQAAGIASITRIGDSLAPGAIVHAVHSGHRYAREFDTVVESIDAELPYTRDFPV
jgi:dimethylamine/trimethylamine dehydrogenase